MSTTSNEPLAVTIVGAAGRMGRRLLACAAALPRMRIVGAADAPGHPRLGDDAGRLAGLDALQVALTADLAAACAPAQVVIDFALAQGVAERMALYARLARAVVLGTTGLDAAGRAAVQRAARGVPVVHAPNFSLGVNLLFALAERAAASLGDDYDVEVIEMHHRRKEDAPSGTAVRLVEVIERARGLAPETVRCHGRQGVTGARPRGQIGIHAVRGGDVVGDHTVIFAAEGERVELVHKAGSRDTFAHGALRAALFVAGKPAGLYAMADVLGVAMEASQ